MKNVFKKLLDRGPVSVTLAVVLSVLFVTGLVNAATTISTNITTGGTLSVTGLSTLSGQASTTVFSANSAEFGASATTTITSAGRIGVASSSPYVALGVTGTTTSSAGMVVGSGGSGITQILFGTCTVTAGSIAASSTLSVNCTATGVSTADKVFVTPYITDNGIIFVSASSTAANTIQISLFNVGLTGAVNPADNTWSWMAIR